MKQVVFISGKGGTGKSTLVASLVQMVYGKQFADCDVDAPNLHLLVGGLPQTPRDYFGSRKAVIDQSLCTHCDLCRQVCRFEAITENHEVRTMSCEGCAACTVLCPVNAISLLDEKTGITDRQQTKNGVFASAALSIGADGSGKLVSQVRRRIMEEKPAERYLLIDGSPGIGCVVISSITGTDAVVVVAEPTQTGRHDMERILDVADHFKIPALVCINKYDLDETISLSLERICKARGVPVAGRILFDENVMEALQNNQTPIDAGIESYKKSAEEIWESIKGELIKNDRNYKH
jgi:MinD superfamily P-loop ATPase